MLHPELKISQKPQNQKSEIRNHVCKHSGFGKLSLQTLVIIEIPECWKSEFWNATSAFQIYLNFVFEIQEFSHSPDLKIRVLKPILLTLRFLKVLLASGHTLEIFQFQILKTRNSEFLKSVCRYIWRSHSSFGSSQSHQNSKSKFWKPSLHTFRILTDRLANHPNSEFSPFWKIWNSDYAEFWNSEFWKVCQTLYPSFAPIICPFADCSKLKIRILKANLQTFKILKTWLANAHKSESSENLRIQISEIAKFRNSEFRHFVCKYPRILHS